MEGEVVDNLDEQEPPSPNNVSEQENAPLNGEKVTQDEESGEELVPQGFYIMVIPVMVTKGLLDTMPTIALLFFLKDDLRVIDPQNPNRLVVAPSKPDRKFVFRWDQLVPRLVWR